MRYRINMSIEICKICEQESTPWVYVKELDGHICDRCSSAVDKILEKYKWIIVEDQMPNYEEYVLIAAYIHNDRQIVEKAILMRPDIRGKNTNDEEYLWYVSDETAYIKNEVTHWMPLPELPE